MQYHLKVASLNFSGINISPFEYHDGSSEKAYLDQEFVDIFEKYRQINPKFGQDLAKLDRNFQKDRYTILYGKECGVVRGKLLNRAQFDILWDRSFDVWKGDSEGDEEGADRLRMFDWMVYQAFLRFLYGEVNQDKLGQYNVQKYKVQLKKWHQKAYLNIAEKTSSVREYILKQELDVLFVQEALIDRAEEFLPSDKYGFVNNANSVIVFRKEKYFAQDEEDVNSFNRKYMEKLNFNKDSCYFKAKNVLLVSVHLTSKKNNVEQAREMFQTLELILRQNRDLIVIVGADVNHKLAPRESFKIFPNTDQPTTRKRRTSLQCQLEKAQKLIEETKDYIITNLPITSSRIETVRSWEPTNELLPNDGHPFDHFLINANLQFDKPRYRSRIRGVQPSFAYSQKLITQQSQTAESNGECRIDKLGPNLRRFNLNPNANPTRYRGPNQNLLQPITNGVGMKVVPQDRGYVAPSYQYLLPPSYQTFPQR